MLRRAFLAWVAAGALACGGGAGAPRSAAEAAAPPPPRDAALIAQSLCDGRVGVMIYSERIRDNPIAPKLAAIDVWRAVLEGTGIDPVKDLDRAFVAAPSARAGEKGVAVAEHHLDAGKIEAAIEVMIGKSQPPGGWIEGSSVPAARIVVRGLPRAVVVPRAGLLVVLPEALVKEAARFAKSGGLSDPEGPEAAIATAVSPRDTLRAPRVPSFPATVSLATARVVLGKDGSAEVALDALSSSPEQAAEDAAEMTRAVEAATTVKVAFIKVRFFEPIVFEAEGEHVKGKLALAPSDIDKLLGFVRAFVPPQR